MALFQPPKPFSPPQSVNQAQAWVEWKEQFLLYLQATEKMKAEEVVKTSMLHYAMGSEWTKVAKTFTYAAEGDEKKLDKVLQKFTEYFEPKKLLKAYVTKFQQRVQKPNESLQDYITAVRDLAAECEFGDLCERQVCIQISNGVRDQKLKEKLWEDDLSLDDVIKRCHQFDQLVETRRIHTTESAQVNVVHRGRGYSRGRGRDNHGRADRGRDNRRHADHGRDDRGRVGRGQGHGSTGQQPPRGRNWKCGKCGQGHQPRQCPAYGKTCHKCKKVGHFSNCCRNTHNVRYTDDVEYESDDEYVWDNVYENVNDDFDSLNVHTAMTKDVFISDTEFTVDLAVPGKQIVKFRIDTAAETSIISSRTYDALKIKPEVTKSCTQIRGLFGASRLPDGHIELPVAYKKQKHMIQCQIFDRNVPNLLSVHDSKKLGLVKRVYHVQSNILDDYSDVFQGVGRIPGNYSLQLTNNAQPVALNARPIPAALREATKLKLDELEKKDIITKIPVGEPTPWCSALHVVPKKTTSPEGKLEVRITMDPQHLNKALKREYHPITTIEDVMTRTNGSKLFTVLDANQGYFQIGLDEESQKITAFNTPFGRYMYKRLPMGISSAPEIYQRAMHDMFSDIEGVEIVMDDILVHGPSAEIHDQRLKQVLARCKERNLKLNPKKTKLRAEEVTYIGHKLSKDGVKIDDEKVKAVLQMPEPTSIANVQTLLGMVTYTCKFLPHLSEVTEPLRYLIKESHQDGFKFHFDEAHREAVQKLKKMMSNAPVLKYYSPKEPLTMSGDASQSGLGAVLLQDGRPIAYGSKALTDTEKNYSQMEKEMLAIVFGMKKFHTYVYGRNDLTVETDHLPLVRIMDKPLQQVPLRLQKMRMALQHYQFRIVGKSGKDIPVADALSRAFLPETETKLLNEVNHANVYAVEVRGLTAFSTSRQEELKEKTKNDKTMQEVLKTIKRGWPSERNQVKPEVKAYWDSRDELAEIDGILFKGDRAVIPKDMQADILKIIHKSHLGMVKCKQLARDIVFWPGMNSQIEDVISKCQECQENKKQQQKEPLLPLPIPSRPWEVVAADLLYCCEKNWLVVTDYYSDFIEVEAMEENTHSTTVIEKLARIFAVHGKPSKLLTDNGPQFKSHQFHQFADEWQIKHETTSPYHHQANGKVERANQTVRHMLQKVNGKKTELYYGLLQLNNTPNPDVSPSQKLMSRRTATKLPTTTSLLQPKVVKTQQVMENIERRQQKSAQHFNRRTRRLEPLKQDDTIRVRSGKKWMPAQLTQQQPAQPRSYNILTEQGKVWRRNRVDLRKTKEKNIFNRDIDWDPTPLSSSKTTSERSKPPSANGPPMPSTSVNDPPMPPTSANSPPITSNGPITSKPRASPKPQNSSVRSNRIRKQPIRFGEYQMYNVTAVNRKD